MLRLPEDRSASVAMIWVPEADRRKRSSREDLAHDVLKYASNEGDVDGSKESPTTASS